MDASTSSGAGRSALEHRADLVEDLAMARVRGKLFAQTPAVVRVGRYLVIERIGRGAHGDVHRAWDERLERTVALKVVRPRTAAAGRAWLDEARALARLVHPNVVTLFDADELPDGQVYLAMELVGGGSFADELARGRASPRAITTLLHGAALGLHAAHRAGLVHRDVKPENLLVTSDGALKIADFGLARILADADETRDAPAVHREGDDRGDTGPTAGGVTSAFAGTPLYMAPEQHLGVAVDARSDQYALCAVAWSALLGRPPFVGDSRDALLAAKRRGPDPVIASALPQRMRRALVRGLSFDPAERHDDLAPLVAAFDPTARRWWPMALMLGAAVVGASVLARTDRSGCDGGAAQLGGTFDAERRDAISRAFAQRPEPYARTSWDSTAQALDGWLADWQATHRELCEAHRRGELSAPSYDARMACLGHRRAELEAVLDRLARPDALVVERALASAHAMRSASACRHARGIDGGVPPAPADVERVQTLVAAAEAAASTGAYTEAGAHADEALVEVERRMPDALRWRGAALLARGRARSLGGDSVAARADLEESVRAAWRAGDEHGLATAATHLVWEHGEIEGGFAVAHLWADFARLALARGGDDDAIAALLDNASGAVATNEHRFELAMLHHVARLDRIARVWGPDDGRNYASLANLGNVAWARGRPADAIEWYERALELGERTLGRTHPQVLALRGNVVGVLRALGRHEEALVEATEVLERQRELLGDEHPDVAATLVNLQTAAQDLGDLGAAVAHGTRAVAIIEATAGSRSRLLIPPLANLAIEHALAGDVARGRAQLERAFELQRATHGEGHGDEVSLLRTAGELELAAGRPAEAERRFAQMHALAVATTGEASWPAALAEVQRARAELGTGAVEAARIRISAALPRLESAAGANPRDLANARALAAELHAAAR